MQDGTIIKTKIWDYEIRSADGTIILERPDDQPGVKPNVGDTIRFKTQADRAWVLFAADPPAVVFADSQPIRPDHPISGTLQNTVSTECVLVVLPLNRKSVCLNAILIIDP